MPDNQNSSTLTKRTSLRLAEADSLPTHRTRGVHRVLAAEPSQAGLAEDVAARVHLVRLEQQVEADGADEGVVELVQFGLGFENVLKWDFEAHCFAG